MLELFQVELVLDRPIPVTDEEIDLLLARLESVTMGAALSSGADGRCRVLATTWGFDLADVARRATDAVGRALAADVVQVDVETHRAWSLREGLPLDPREEQMTREEAAALLGVGRAEVDEWLPRRRGLRRLRRTASVDRAEVGRLLRVAERLA